MTQINELGAAQATAGSQISIVDSLQPGTTPTRPFIIHFGADVTAAVSRNPSAENDCGLNDTENSRYILNRPDHQQIPQLFLTGPDNRLGYSLDIAKDVPSNISYNSTSVESLLSLTSSRDKLMLGWILANLFPMTTAAETFSELGVDASAPPALDGSDAYAAVQTALWLLLGQIGPDEVYFFSCSEGNSVHPKSERLREAVLRILELAGNYADAASTPRSRNRGNVCGCDADPEQIVCRSQGVIPDDAAMPYLIFERCPDEVRAVWGRTLVGPFRLKSNFSGQPSITIEPVCYREDELFAADFMDFCGNKIEDPSIGQEFYIALRAGSGCLCFYLNASFCETVTRIITLRPAATEHQNCTPVGTAFEDQAVTLQTSICVCMQNPDQSYKQAWPYPEINIYNNVNSSDCCPSDYMPIGCPDCCWPPCPPCPTEPPYPSCPPEPPCPPCPTEPPCPPCPTEPPCPPCPTEPPCPPCPTDPPNFEIRTEPCHNWKQRSHPQLFSHN